MPALQVRDFPQPLYDELKVYAAQNHRSIAQQVIVAVEDMIRPKPKITAVPLQQKSTGSVPIDLEGAQQARIEKRRAIFADAEIQPEISSDKLAELLELAQEAQKEWEEDSYNSCLPYMKELNHDCA